MQRIIIILFSVSMHWSCLSSPDQVDNTAILQHYPGYSLEYIATESPDDYDIKLFANPESGKVMAIVNYDPQNIPSIDLRPENFLLIASEGGRSHPKDTALSLTSDNREQLLLHYEIVHDRRFYNKTRLNGDLNQSYTLQISNVKDPVTFQLSENKSSAYIENYGIEDATAIFNVVVDTAAQKEYQKNIGLSTFLHADDVEVSIAGVNLHLRAYKLNNELTLDIKVVNHSQHELVIQPDVFIIKSGSMLLQPRLSHSEAIRLRKSERYIQDFIYSVEKPILHFELVKEAIQIIVDAKQQNLFLSNIIFKKSE